jgi:hypothetical protein
MEGGIGENENIYVHVFGGGFAGMLAEGIVYPIDTIRVRVQMNRSENFSSIKTFKNVLKNEGISSLYKGFSIVAFASVLGVLFFCN